LKPKHWLVFILLGAIWSSSFMWIKIAVQEISPTMLVAFRALFGLLFGIVVIFIQHVQWPRSFKSWFPLLLLGLTNVAIPFFLISWGEKFIDSAVASVLDATVPLFTILIAHYLLHDDKITLPKVLGLLIGFAGVVVLMSKDLLNASTNSVLGQAAVILASIFYAVNSVYIRKTTEDIPGIVRSAGPLISAPAVM
jgi:drug/metabolite transporter (DMT)-like permease